MTENLDELLWNGQVTYGAGRQELLKKLLAETDTQEFSDVMASLPNGKKKSCMVEAALQLPDEEKKSAIKEAAAQLPRTQRQELAQELTSPIPRPDPRTSSVLWIIAVVGLSIVLVGTFVTIAFDMFLAPEGGLTSPELVLTMFTSVIGFLAGLFVGDRQG
jgi:hypothetical protein